MRHPSIPRMKKPFSVPAERPARRIAAARDLAPVPLTKPDELSATGFMNTKFSPDGHVVGNGQGLLFCQVKLLHEVKHRRAANEFGRGAPVENDVVIRLGSARIGFDSLERVGDVGQMAQRPRCDSSHIEITQQDDIVLQTCCSCPT